MKPQAALFVIFLSTLNSQLLTLSGQSTAFTYQGRLTDGSNPANGLYDFRFTVYDSANGGAAQGLAITNAAVTLSNGLFNAALDFGANVFTGADRWLELGVRTNGSDAFATLASRQRITA